MKHKHEHKTINNLIYVDKQNSYHSSPERREHKKNEKTPHRRIYEFLLQLLHFWLAWETVPVRLVPLAGRAPGLHRVDNLGSFSSSVCASDVGSVQAGVCTGVCARQGARSLNATEDSLPLGCRTLACVGLSAISSTSSTNGSFLLCLTKRRRSTRRGFNNQIGKELPRPERRKNWRNTCVESRLYLLSIMTG